MAASEMGIMTALTEDRRRYKGTAGLEMVIVVQIGDQIGGADTGSPDWPRL